MTPLTNIMPCTHIDQSMLSFANYSTYLQQNLYLSKTTCNALFFTGIFVLKLGDYMLCPFFLSDHNKYFMSLHLASAIIIYLSKVEFWLSKSFHGILYSDTRICAYLGICSLLCPLS